MHAAGISRGSVIPIFNNHLIIRNISARRIPPWVTIDHERNGLKTLKVHLALVNRNMGEFLHCLIPVDESLIHRNTSPPSSSRNSGVIPSELVPNKAKVGLAIVF